MVRRAVCMCVCVYVTLESEGGGRIRTVINEVSGCQDDNKPWLGHKTSRSKYSHRHRTTSHQHYSLIHSVGSPADIYRATLCQL